MAITRSGDYKLPGPLQRSTGNLLVAGSKWAPAFLRRRYLQRPTAYQVFDDSDTGAGQGKSINKWKALQLPTSLAGKSVLDIGCADGFFCQLCVKSGARRVVGIDSALGRLLRARLAALEAGLDIEFRMEVFPDLAIREKFDYVLCLSVLHHFLADKDLWKTFQGPDLAGDLAALGKGLKALLSLTAPGGACVIEMPYEYDDLAERREINFERFCQELTRAGFTRTRCLGGWAHEARNQEKKDRIIYVAQF
jgi:SAM-dependent methyltransferase